ncbi:MAG: hypothetical protein WCP19_12910 [Chloroflexota bacterium]
MNVDMEEEVKRWTARRKSTLVREIIQGRAVILPQKWGSDYFFKEEIE